MNGEQARFKKLEDLSDSEEEEMEMGSDQETSGNQDDPDQPPTKKQKTEEPPKPKWSNPDPYTALPPPDESHVKRKDFVQLIRKAKVEVAHDKTTIANDNDFISLDFGGDQKEDSSSSDDEVVFLGKSQAAPQPSFSHLDALHPDRFIPGTTKPSEDLLGPPPPPPPGLMDDLDRANNFQNTSRSVGVDVWPPPPPPPDHVPAPPQGRKRGRDEFSDKDGIDSSYGSRRGRKEKGDVVAEWLPKHNGSASASMPWCTVDHGNVEDTGVRLHKEIADFYHYAKPRDFENAIRQNLVTRVGDFLKRRYADAEVRFFGSFAAGLYLPNADMDLVVLSRTYKNGGYPVLGQSKKLLYRFANDLTSASLARPGSTVVIAGAKVPIVKYVDMKTGLKVDISFENETGLIANRTYNNWKREFPAMPVIVTMVKQFLMMRGLHEVFTGGLGGFGVTCMVVSLLQHMPQVRSGNMDPMSHLGEVFMTFLDFYGNKLNTTTTGIRLNPPEYFKKVCIVEPM